VRRRHTRRYLALAERAEPELRGQHQVEWLDRLELESDNVRAAVGWSLEGGDVSDAIRIARGLTMYWVMRGGHREGRAWMERALDRGGNQPVNVRAEALYVLAICEYGLGNDERLMAVSEESAALYRQVGDRYGEALASGMGGFAALRMGELDRAEAILDKAAGVMRELGDRWITALFLDHLAVVPLRRGEYARAARYVEEALELSRQTGDRLAMYTSLHILAQAAQGWGDHELAARYFGEALRITYALGDRAAAAYCLQGLARVAEARGDGWHVARLIGAAEALLETVVPPRWAFLPDRRLHERAGCAAREQLGEEAFESARSEGRAMLFQEAVEYALSANAVAELR
jgi:tetratricopeptide (TPR) repeat protein